MMIDEIERALNKLLDEIDRLRFALGQSSARVAEYEEFERDIRQQLEAARADNRKYREQLAAMTAARDEACEIASEVLGDMSGGDAMEMRHQIAALRKVGTKRDNYDAHTDDCRCAYHDGNG